MANIDNREIYKEAVSGRLVDRFSPRECLNFQTPGQKNNVLHIACQHNHGRILERVVADDDVEQQEAASIFRPLLFKGNFINETPFHFAVKCGHTDTVKLLHRYFMNQNVLEQAGQVIGFGGELVAAYPWKIKTLVDEETVLHMAIKNGFQDIAVFLLNKVDPELATCVNNAGESPLYLAAENWCFEVLEEILKGMNYSVSGPNGQNPLHAAAKSASVAACKHLMEENLEFIHGKDENGKTPLHLAVEYEHENVVKILLEKDHSKATSCIHDNEGLTPLLRAATKGYFPVIKTILTLSPESATTLCDSKKGRNIIHLLQNMKCQEELRSVLGHQLNCKLGDSNRLMINEQDRDGNTPLHLSILKGDVDKAIALLEIQVMNWRVKNHQNKTPRDLLNDLKEMDLTTAQQDKISLTYPQMLLIQHAIHIRESVLHPLSLIKSNPSCNHINLLKPSLARRESEDLKKMMDGNGIALVATLVVTLTFAAALQVPGGYDDDGSIVLITKPSLKSFFFSDTIVMLLCILIILDYAWSYARVDQRDLAKMVFRQPLSLSISLLFTVVAFISILYTVAPPGSIWLMHLVSVVTIIIMTWLVYLLLPDLVDLMFLWFPINLSFVIPIIGMGSLTYVGMAAFRDFTHQKASISKKQNS